MKIVTAAERPDLIARAHAVSGSVWPEYNDHGDVLAPRWAELDSVFARFQLVLYDDGADAVLAYANAIPCWWDGSVDGLPGGIDTVFSHGFALLEKGRPVNTLSALAVAVPEQHRGAGHSRVMIEAMRQVASDQGFRAVIVPVRPTLKHRYPLTPIERYAAWVREDGLPFDPWIRTHVRLGGDVLRAAPKSLRITGSVADWEGWTGMSFPEDGKYVFPDGLSLLVIDRARDRGSYWEPNVWVRHRVPE